MFKWYGSGGIDFKDNIHLKPFDLDIDEGMIQCEFVKDNKTSLQIRHKFFDGLCLAWVVT